jgi:hypothetical protein
VFLMSVIFLMSVRPKRTPGAITRCALSRDERTASRRRKQNSSHGTIFLVCATHRDFQRVIWQWPLQRLCPIPRRASRRRVLHPWSGSRHGLRVDRTTTAFGAVVRKAWVRCGPRIGLDLVPPSPLYSVQMPAKAKSGRGIAKLPRRANHNNEPVIAPQSTGRFRANDRQES